MLRLFFLLLHQVLVLKANVNSASTSKIKIKDCRATTAYAFITQNGIETWKAWETYFAGCQGDYIVRIANGQSGLRYSYKMVDVMLDLIESALVGNFTAAHNGCLPNWIHFASATCLPLVSCHKTRERLRSSTGKSFTQWIKSAQWMTLWAPHARELIKENRSAWVAFWRARHSWQQKLGGISYRLPPTLSISQFDQRRRHPPDNAYGAPDEVVISAEIALRGYAVAGQTLLFNTFNDSRHQSRLPVSNFTDLRHGEPGRASTFLGHNMTDFWRLAHVLIDNGFHFIRKGTPLLADFISEHLSEENAEQAVPTAKSSTEKNTQLDDKNQNVCETEA